MKKHALVVAAASLMAGCTWASHEVGTCVWNKDEKEWTFRVKKVVSDSGELGGKPAYLLLDYREGEGFANIESARPYAIKEVDENTTEIECPK